MQPCYEIRKDLTCLPPAALDLMAETTLRVSQDGNGYELQCLREFEAKIMDECKTYAHVSKFTDVQRL